MSFMGRSFKSECVLCCVLSSLCHDAWQYACLVLLWQPGSEGEDNMAQSHSRLVKDMHGEQETFVNVYH